MRIALLSILLLFCFTLTYSYTREITGTPAHKEAGIGCVACHGADTPERRAPVSACKGCHGNSDGTYKGKLDKDGKPVKQRYLDGNTALIFNFHDSHDGDLRCTVCHTVHAKPSQPEHCNACHKFAVQVK